MYITSNIWPWRISFPQEQKKKNVTQVWICVVQPGIRSEFPGCPAQTELMNAASDFSYRNTTSEED